jgi:hypothetical protein
LHELKSSATAQPINVLAERPRIVSSVSAVLAPRRAPVDFHATFPVIGKVSAEGFATLEALLDAIVRRCLADEAGRARGYERRDEECLEHRFFRSLESERQSEHFR